MDTSSLVTADGDPRKVKDIFAEYALIQWEADVHAKFDALKHKYNAEAQAFVEKHKQDEEGAWDKLHNKAGGASDPTGSPEWFLILRKQDQKLIAAMEFNLKFNKDADKLVAENANFKRHTRFNGDVVQPAIRPPVQGPVTTLQIGPELFRTEHRDTIVGPHVPSKSSKNRLCVASRGVERNQQRRCSAWLGCSA